HAPEHFNDQTFVVENKDGGGASIGDEYVASSDPDGYTLLLMGGSVVTNPLLSDVPYTTDSFTPVATYSRDAELLLVPEDSEFDTLDEFLQKSSEESITMATSGSQTPHHVAGVMLANEEELNFDFLHGSASEMYQQLLGGHVDAAMSSGGEAVNHVKNGSLKALGVMAEERMEELPDVPTFEENGIDMVYGPFRGVAVPSDTPEEIVQELDQRFEEVFQDEQLMNDFKESGFEVHYLNSEETKNLLEEEISIVEDALPNL